MSYTIGDSSISNNNNNDNALSVKSSKSNKSNKSYNELTREHKQDQWKLGLSLLSVVVILWVLSSFLINLIFEDQSYRKPFFITYINTASFTAYLIIPLSRHIIKLIKNSKNNDDIKKTLSFKQLIIDALNTPQFTIVHTTTTKTSTNKSHSSSSSSKSHSSTTPGESDSLLSNSSNHAEDAEDAEDVDSLVEVVVPLGIKKTITLSAQFCILWFAANFVTNASLSYTSVGSQTILSSTSSFFTLLIGYLCRLDRSISKLKIIGLIISFIGIILITKSDISITLETMKLHTHKKKLLVILFGNFLAILGALLYGIYSTLLKLKVKNVNRLNMHVFFGFIGLITIFCLWPILILLNYTGYETFQIPYTKKIWGIIILNLVINFLSDYCWCKAMLLTSPLTVTVGLSFTIPFAMCGDFIFKHRKLSSIYLLGASMILLSFFIIDREEKSDDNDDDDEETNSVV